MRVLVRIQLSAEAVQLANSRFVKHNPVNDDKLGRIQEAVLSELITADLLYFDSQVPLIYHEDVGEQGADEIVCRHVDPPSVRYIPDPHAQGCVLAYVAPRSLPISSAHGGRTC